jgi:hypothetical protein
VLVRDLADDLLEEIFNGDEADTPPYSSTTIAIQRCRRWNSFKSSATFFDSGTKYASRVSSAIGRGLPSWIASKRSLTCTMPTTVSIVPRTAGMREYFEETKRSARTATGEATSIQRMSVRGVMTPRTRVSPKSTIERRSFSSSFSRIPSSRPTSM